MTKAQQTVLLAAVATICVVYLWNGAATSQPNPFIPSQAPGAVQKDTHKTTRRSFSRSAVSTEPR
eukprot:m.70196 g.70196  ORF g.70196 m.70196 type:complete len:65 (+) comp18484_c0_seq2:119-313(+)